MKRVTLLLLALLCLAPAASAQITITRADLAAQMNAATTTATYEGTSTSGLEAVVAAKGGNQTWDLSGISFEKIFEGVTRPATLPAPGSDDPHLSQASFVQEASVRQEAEVDSVSYVYYDLTDDAFAVLGVAGEMDFDEDGQKELMVLRFKPRNTIMKLPMTMGTTWAETTEMEIGGFEMPFTTTYEESYEVEGWGVLRTPRPGGGTRSDDALMVRNRTVSVTAMPGFPEMRDTSYTISFFTKTGFGASISLDEMGAPMDVTLNVSDASSVDTETETELPNGVALHPGHPNPFNPQATIPFTLAQAGAVRLEVFDVLGRRVATLVDEVRPAGAHEVRWTADHLPSGTYVVRLTAMNQMRATLLTLQK